jgi:uncharacterized protein YaiI (UPF0178 family)
LYIPIVEGLEYLTCEINELIKQGNIEEVMRQQGKIILTKLSFTEKDNENLLNIWKKLRDRRQRN